MYTGMVVLWFYINGIVQTCREKGVKKLNELYGDGK